MGIEPQKPQTNKTEQVSSSEPPAPPHRHPLKYLWFVIVLPVIVYVAYYLVFAIWAVIVIGFNVAYLFFFGFGPEGRFADLPYKPNAPETRAICDTYFGHWMGVVSETDPLEDRIGLRPYTTSISFKVRLPSTPQRRQPSESKCYYNERTQAVLDYGDGSEKAIFDLSASNTAEEIYTTDHTYYTAGIYPITVVLSAVRPVDDDALTNTTTIGTIGVLLTNRIPQSVIDFYNNNLDKELMVTFCKRDDAGYFYDVYFIGKGKSTFFDVNGKGFDPYRGLNGEEFDSHRRPHNLTPTACAVVAQHDPANHSDEVAPYWAASTSTIAR